MFIQKMYSYFYQECLLFFQYSGDSGSPLVLGLVLVHFVVVVAVVVVVVVLVVVLVVVVVQWFVLVVQA